MAKSLSCKHCQLAFESFSTSQRANHSRWCKLNPKLSEYKQTNSGEQLRTQTAIEKRKLGIKKAHAEGKYIGSAQRSADTKKKNGTDFHTEQTKQKISERALASNHQRVCKSTHEFIDKRGRVFKFDSKWEDALANRLDDLDINWDRPQPITYELNGKTKKYYSDFYLPEYDVYLDPKNSYCENVQKEKLDIVSNQIKLIILRSLQECQSFEWPARRDSNPH